MRKLRSQHYLLLTLSVLAIFAASSAYAFMYIDTVKEAQDESIVKAEAAAAAEQSLQAKNMETTYDNTVADRELLPSFLISANDAVPFIDAVEAIGPATDAKISISSLSSGTGGNSSVPVVTADISVVGSWGNVMRAIQMVENMPYAISVGSINLDVLSGGNSSAKSASRWTAVIDISVLSST
jgi:hypothetical protein